MAGYSGNLPRMAECSTNPREIQKTPSTNLREMAGYSRSPLRVPEKEAYSVRRRRQMAGCSGSRRQMAACSTSPRRIMAGYLGSPRKTKMAAYSENLPRVVVACSTNPRNPTQVSLANPQPQEVSSAHREALRASRAKAASSAAVSSRPSTRPREDSSPVRPSR